MDRRRKKSQRKVIHLLYRKKNVPPLSQMLTITSQTKKIKNLVQNNRALAFAAHEAQSEVATYKSMLQDYLKDRNQVMFAQLKIKDMAETIKKLVSDLEEVSACLNLSSKDILPTQTDYARLRSKMTSLSTIREADSSLSEEEGFTPLEEGKDCTLLEGLQENSNNVEDRILNTDSVSCPVYPESVKENACKKLIANNEAEISLSLEKQSNTVEVAVSQPSLVAGRKSKRYSEGCPSKVDKSAFSNIEKSNEFNEAELLNENPNKLERENSALFKKPIIFETNLKASKIPILLQSKEDQNKLTENLIKPKENEYRRETFVVSACSANAPESSMFSNQRRGTFVIAHPEASKSSILDRRGTYVLSSPERNIVDRRGTYVLSTFDEQSTKAVDKPVESNLSRMKTCESTVLNNTILLPEDMELTGVITFPNTFSTKNNVNGLETSISPPSVTLGINKDTLLHDEMQPIDTSERSADKLVSQDNNSFKTRLLCENGSVPTETEDSEKVIFSDHNTKGSAKQSLSKESVTKKSIPVKYKEDCKSSEVLKKPASDILEKETTFFNGICALDPIAVVQADSETKPRLSQQRKVRKSTALYKKESISKLLEGKDDFNSEVQNLGKDAALQNFQCSGNKKQKVSKSGILYDKKSLVESSKEERDYSHHGLEHERDKILEKFVSEEERTCVPETLAEGMSPVVPLGPRVSKRCKSAQKYSVYFTTSDSESNSTSDEEFIMKPRKVKGKRIEYILPKEEVKGENKTSETSQKEKSLNDSANQRISKRSRSAQKYFEFSTDLETSMASNEELNKEPENPVKEKKWTIQPRRVVKGKSKYEYAFRKRTSLMSSNDEIKNQKLVFDEKNIFYFSNSPETRSSSDGSQTHRNFHSKVTNDQETVSQIYDTKEVKEKLLSREQRKSRMSISYKKPAKISRQSSCKLSAVTGDGSESCNVAENSSHKDNADVIESKPIADSLSVSEANECHKNLELTNTAIEVLKDYRGKNTCSNKSNGICTDVSKKHVEYSPEAAKTKKMALSKTKIGNEDEDFVLNGGSQIKPKRVAKQENGRKEKSRKCDFESVENFNKCLDVSKNKLTEIRVSDIVKEKCTPLDVVEQQFINKERDLDHNLVSSKAQSYDEEKNRMDNKIENDCGKINYDIQEEVVIENPAGKLSIFDNDDVQSQKNKTKASTGRKSILATRTKTTNHRKVSISNKRVSICENVMYFDQKEDISKPLKEAKPVKEASKLISKLQSRESTDVADIDTGTSKSNSSSKFDLFQNSHDANGKLPKVATSKMPKRSGKAKLDKSVAEDVVDLDVVITGVNCISEKPVNVDKTNEESNSAFCYKEESSENDLVNKLKRLIASVPVSAEPVLIGTSFAKITKTAAKSKTKKSNNKRKNALSHDENVCTLNVVNPEIKPTLNKDANYGLKSDVETYEKENNLLPLRKKSSSKQAVDLCKKDLEKNSISTVKEKESRSLPTCIASDLDLLDKPSDTANSASGRKRRARLISYKEPSLNVKLRRDF